MKLNKIDKIKLDKNKKRKKDLEINPNKLNHILLYITSYN